MISIDITGRTPIYEQICRSIRGEITRGILKENDRIPSSRSLAQQLGLNPNTVAKAYSILERDGIIYTVAGKGSFIASGGSRADETFTRDFEQKTLEALTAGVPADTLIEIVKKTAESFEKK